MKSLIQCIRIVATIFVIVLSSGFVALSQTSWRGTTNSNWNTAGNWTNGVPTAAVDAIIGDANFVGVNQPNVNANAACKSLTIGAEAKACALTVSNKITVSGGFTIGGNATITHNSNSVISLTGDWSNDGIYNPTNKGATVTFAGTSQSLTGPSAFETMIINAGSTLTLHSSISVNQPLTVNGTLEPASFSVTMINNFVVNAGGKIRVNTPLFSGNYSKVPTMMNGAGTVEYTSSSAAQTVANTLAYGTLLISGTSTKTLAGNLPNLSNTAAANGNILVTGGTLDLAGFTANRAGAGTAGGTLSVSNGATLKIGGTISMPTNFVTHTFGPSSTVEYDGAAQTVPAETFGNLTLSSAGNKTAAGAMTIAGNFSLSNATFIGGNFTHAVSGDWTMSSGTFTNTGTTISINGGSTHNVSSTGAFNKLTVNAAGGSVNAGSDITVNSTLTLTAGVVTTGGNKVILPATGSVSRTSGYVNGNLQKHASAGPANLTFEVGSASAYAPANVSFANVTTGGDLNVSTTGSEHPSIASSNIDPTKDVNRYWTMTNAGIGFTTYNVTLNYVSGDVDAGANTANFDVHKYNSPTWVKATTGTRTATSTQATGLTSFSDFAIGEFQMYTISASSGLNGSITPSGGVVVSKGSNQSFIITPSAHYHVADVLVDGSSVGAVASYDFNNVTANHTIAASFTIDQNTITATAGANGSLSPNGAVLVNYGADQAFTVTPNTGYHLDSVLVDGVNQGAVGAYTFINVTAAHTIRTVYAINQYTLTATTGPNGAISPSGSFVVNYGSDQLFTMTPNTNYHVDSVLVDGVNVGAVGVYTITSVAANHTIRAVYAIDQFTITATAGANGSLTPSGSVAVNMGSDQAFTVTPNAGYHIDSVLVDGADVGPVGAYTFTNVTVNHTIRTVYAVDQFTITATTDPNGSITPSGAVLVNYGSDQLFTMTPNSGYHVANILVDGSPLGAAPSYTFNNVTGNHTIAVSYVVDAFEITASAGPNGTISPSGSVGASSGDNVLFTITPATGYHVLDVNVDGSSVGAVTSYNFVNVTANHTIDASFAIDQFTITASADPNGSISPNGASVVNYGDSLAVTITPDANYTISDVKVDNVSVGQLAGYTFTNVSANHTIQASFALVQHTITASAGANGSISPNGSVPVDHGASQAFTIAADAGYHVSDVHVDSVSVGAVTSYSFTSVTANHTIEAFFAITQYTITASAGANGSISPSGAVLVDHGSSQGFTITANAGYHIDSVLVDGAEAGPVGAYTFTNVTADHTIRTVYAIDQFTINATTGPNGSITPSGSVGVSYGASQGFTITPDTGYYVADVHVDSVSVGAVTSYSFTNVTANHTIHAIFAITQYTINASAGSNGVISPGGSVLVDHGASQGFTITPNAGYFVSDVHVDSVSVGQVTSYTFTNVTANHTIQASFAIEQFKVNATAGAHGTITPVGSTVVNYGDSLAFTITADSGYFVANVQADTFSIGPVTRYTFYDITSNHTIAASFTQSLNPAPVLTSVTPSSGYRGDTLDVTYKGRHFINGVTSLPGVADIGSEGVVILSDSELVHHIVVGVNASLGAHGLFVFNAAPGGGYSDTVAFTVLNHAPSAARLTVPASGDTLVIDNLGPAVGFGWHPSLDADVTDALIYSIHLSGPGIDSVLTGLTDTTVQWGITSMLQAGRSYWWTVNVTDGQVVTASPDTFTFHATSTVNAVLGAGMDIPKVYALFQNFPNPFNPTTVVRFDLPRASEVRITVYNMIGQEVKVLVDQSSMGAGHHEVRMDAGSIASGVYLYRIIAKDEKGDVFSKVKKMVLVK